MANLTNNTNEIIFDDIFNKINTNVTQAVKETLTPFISKMKEEKTIYQEIVSVMKKMPEFKKIINENEILVNENGLLVNENELLLKERDYLLKFGVVKKAETIEVDPIEENLSAPIESAPIESAHIESAPIESAPIESAPIESAPIEVDHIAESIEEKLVIEHIEKSNELVSEEKMPIVIKEEKIENISHQKQNKQTITLEITNHHETILEDNLDDKIKQIYLHANLLDSQPQSGNATASASASASASESEAEEEDLEELAEQLNDAASEASASEVGEEAASEAEEEVEDEIANEVASANEVESDSESDSEPEEVFIVDIKDKGQFYTTDEQNGDIYEILVDSNDDIGEKIGKFKDGKAIYF